MEDLETALRKVKDLRRDLSSDIVIQEEKKGYVQHYPEGHALECLAEWDVIKPRITKGDVAKGELKQIYESSDFQEARKSAGDALGYSDFKIWRHEHPIAATLTGIAAAGAASGLSYMLYQYFSK